MVLGVVVVTARWGWVDCVCMCTAVQLSAGGCGGDHCHCGWVDQVWACSWMLHWWWWLPPPVGIIAALKCKKKNLLSC